MSSCQYNCSKYQGIITRRISSSPALAFDQSPCRRYHTQRMERDSYTDVTPSSVIPRHTTRARPCPLLSITLIHVQKPYLLISMISLHSRLTSFCLLISVPPIDAVCSLLTNFVEGHQLSQYVQAPMVDSDLHHISLSHV